MDVTQVTPVSQQTGDIYHWEECFEGALSSMCIDDGHPVDVKTLSGWIETNKGVSHISGGTNLDDALELSRVFGWTDRVRLVRGSIRSVIQQASQSGEQLIWLIWSDGLGNPGTRHTGHFIRIVSTDGFTYLVMNPLGSPIPGTVRTYLMADIEDNDQQVGFAYKLGVGTPTPVPGLNNDFIQWCQQEGLDVAQTANALARILEQLENGRNFQGDNAVQETQMRADQIKNQGLEWTQLQLQNAPEAQAKRDKKKAVTGFEY